MAMQRIELSKEEVVDITNAERRIHDLLPLFDLGEQCGIECQTLRAQAIEMQEQIAVMRTNFFPRQRA